MAHLQKMPVINPNDEEVFLSEWLKQEDEKVEEGEPICVVETSKAVEEVEAERNGFVVPIAEEGTGVKIQAPLAAIKENPEEDVKNLLEKSGEKKDSSTKKSEERGWTKKAEILAQKHDVKISDVPSSGIVKEEDIKKFLKQENKQNSSKSSKFSDRNILLLGGGGHAKMCIDIIKQQSQYEIAGIVDSKIDLGNKVLGIPVIGRDKDLDRFYNQGLKYAVNAVGAVTNHTIRENLYNRLIKAGFNLPPLVHPTATVEPSATLGAGTQVMAGAVVGSSAKIGKNCIINSGSIVSHDCEIKNHVHIAPGAVLAGTVTADKNTLIGMDVTVYINMDIGENVTIKNGQDIFQNIADGTEI